MLHQWSQIDLGGQQDAPTNVILFGLAIYSFSIATNILIARQLSRKPMIMLQLMTSLSVITLKICFPQSVRPHFKYISVRALHTQVFLLSPCPLEYATSHAHELQGEWTPWEWTQHIKAVKEATVLFGIMSKTVRAFLISPNWHKPRRVLQLFTSLSVISSNNICKLAQIITSAVHFNRGVLYSWENLKHWHEPNCQNLEAKLQRKLWSQMGKGNYQQRLLFGLLGISAFACRES